MPIADAPSIELSMPELQALQSDLAVLMTGVQKLQRQLYHATQAADERVSILQVKVEELEAQNLSRALVIRQLEQENQDLHRVVETKDQELAAVTRERNDVQKELAKAQKVIEDLLGRQKCSCQAFKSPRPPNNVSSKASTQVKLVPAQKPQHPKREIPVESDDESTVRPPRSAASVSAAPVARAPPVRVDTISSKRSTTRSSSQSSTHETDASTSAVADSPEKRTTSRSKTRLSWYLELSRPPATCTDLFPGPIPFDILTNNLLLEEEVIDMIGSLDYEPGYDTRIHIDADLAFVYRPVILEGPLTTYLIGWGDANMARKTRDWLNGIRDDLNLFFYPAIEPSRAGWFYLGKHKLTYAPIDSVWDKLIQKDKDSLLAELEARNASANMGMGMGDMDAAKFERDISEGRLVQVCIRLENVGKKSESLDFLREHGLLPGDARKIA